MYCLYSYCRYDLSFKEVQSFAEKDPDDTKVLAE